MCYNRHIDIELAGSTDMLHILLSLVLQQSKCQTKLRSQGGVKLCVVGTILLQLHRNW